MKLFRSTKTERPQPVQLSRQEALQCQPVINDSIHVENSGEGDIVLEYPLPLKPFFLSLFQRFQKSYEYPTKKLQLDEMGSHVWKYIDGQTSVKSMIEDFASHYGVTQQEAEQSITAFLVELGKRGIIAMR
ncbi:MAG: PqqD family protein [Desulfocapsaceae bacterium]|nr:PqqD family protein [Desulfocapsaceae bacterium]